MCFSLLLGEEQTGGLDDVFSADFIPLEVCGILLSGHADAVAIDHEVTVFHFDAAVKLAVHRVVLEHVSHVLHVNQVVDADHNDVIPLLGCPENQTADTSETVDTYFNFFHLLIMFKTRLYVLVIKNANVVIFW